MESLFRCRQCSSVDSDGGPTIPGGIALQRLNRGTSTDAGDDGRPPRSQRDVQTSSICPAVRLATHCCSEVNATDSELDARGLYWLYTSAFHRLLREAHPTPTPTIISTRHVGFGQLLAERCDATFCYCISETQGNKSH